jgi:phage-related protein
MAWTVETLGPIVDREIRSLPPDIQAAFLRLAERIEVVGLERVGHPHVRHLRGKLWEMRLSGRGGIGRAIYVTQVSQRVVVVHAFVKKTQKTPDSALLLAEKRSREIGQ